MDTTIEHKSLSDADELAALLASDDIGEIGIAVASLLEAEFPIDEFVGRLMELKDENRGGLINLPLGDVVSALLDARGFDKYEGSNAIVLDLIERIKSDNL